MQYFLFILATPFLFFNYKIIHSDIRRKIIPNKFLLYLIYLVPFHFYYIWVTFPEVSIIAFTIQILFALVISFTLYYFWIWSAGDAKYLLVLSLFIPHIGIVPFIGNIALLTLLYLIGYFIYFYFYKSIFIRSYRRSLWRDVGNDLKDKFTHFLHNPNGEIVKKTAIFKLFKWILIFLMIFVVIRLSRIYLLNSTLGGENGEGSRYVFLQKILEDYHIYVIALFLLGFIGLIYLIRIAINKSKDIIMARYQKYGLNNAKLNIILLSVLFLWLVWFISHELVHNFNTISIALYRIFTIYIILYLIAKIFIYSYKITFWIAEQDYMKIKDLKEWEIVDKNYLIKMFWNQKALWHIDEWEKRHNTKALLYPNPLEYFKKLENPIDEETTKILKKAYAAVNRYHARKKTPNYWKIEHIKILKTFSFWGYIFCWFMITYFLGNSIFRGILDYMIDVVKSFYV